MSWYWHLQAGGLSGRPLFESSTAVLRDMYRLTKGKLPIVGCGGVSSGQDAYEKIKAGGQTTQAFSPSLLFQVIFVVCNEMAPTLPQCLFSVPPHRDHAPFMLQRRMLGSSVSNSLGPMLLYLQGQALWRSTPLLRMMAPRWFRASRLS